MQTSKKTRLECTSAADTLKHNLHLTLMRLHLQLSGSAMQPSWERIFRQIVRKLAANNVPGVSRVLRPFTEQTD